MPITDRKKFVSDHVKEVLGYPIISFLEAEVSQADYDAALLRYYTTAPILRFVSYTANHRDENLIDIKSLIDSQFPEQVVTGIVLGTSDSAITKFLGGLRVPIKKGSVVVKRNGTQIATDNTLGAISGTDNTVAITGTIDYHGGQLSVSFAQAPTVGNVTVDYVVSNEYYFCIGVVNQDFKSVYTPFYNLDRYLLGVDTGIDQYDEIDPLKHLARISVDRQFSGQVQFEVRETEGEKGTIHILSRGVGSITLTVGFGYGLMDYIPFQHLLAFTGFVAERYLERIIAARSFIKVAADYEVNLDLMEKRLSEIKEQNIMNSVNISVPVALGE